MSKISALPRFSGPPYEPSSQSADRETLKFSLSMSLALAVPSQKEPEYIAAKIGYKAAFCSMTAESADKPPREITKVLTERGNEQNAAYAGIPHSFILQPLSGFSYQEESVDDGEGRFNGYARLSFHLAYARKARRKNEVSFYSKS